MATPAPKDETPDERILREAKKRFKRVEDWEAVARKRYVEDTRFANGDADNMYQWPDALKDARGFGTEDERPCLTINKTRQHVLQIINDARQNKTSVKFRPVGNQASFEAAQVYDGIYRHIEYISDAQSAYSTATRHQVTGGMGYIRVGTDYAGPNTLDQEIFIRRVKDPLTIYMDPDISEANGSDARFAFVFEDVPTDELEERVPEAEDETGTAALGNEDGWITEDHTRIAEYWRKVPTKDRLLLIPQEDGSETMIRLSELPDDLRKHYEKALAGVDNPQLRWRDIVEDKVEWFLIVGDKIVDRRDWPGKYIPIARVPGEETVIDGEMDRKGHVRALKDPQRMYNYNASSQVEFGALQTKAPWVGPAEAFEGYETYWGDANTKNFGFLPYNGLNDAGQPIQAPQRPGPPTAAPAYEVGLQTAANDMMLVSGQYQADMGAPSNERSGRAIEQRQRQGANATYHYIDHLAMAIRFVGKIILDLIPHIYDTKRVIRIMAEDGTSSEVLIDPNAAQAYMEKQVANDNTAKQVILNPSVGTYDVMADVGPDYATRRQEAFNALSQTMAANSELMMIIGDLLFKSADFEFAGEIAQRLERMVPAQAKSDGPDPQMQGMQAQMQSLQQLVGVMQQKLQEKELALKNKSDKAETDQIKALTDQFRAVTDRLDVFFAHNPSPRLAAEQAHELETLGATTAASMVQAEHAAAIAPAPQGEAA